MLADVPPLDAAPAATWPPEPASAADTGSSAASTLRHTIAAAELHLGDCLAVMRAMPDNSVDAIVTDPPYGLSFMGKRWDYDVPSVAIWAECLRVLKPGGHLLAFAGTRTQHRMAVRIEDAGFEIRDMIAWVYGSGFPKSLDVSKAIDGSAGEERPDAIKGGHMGISIRGGDARSERAEFLQKAVPSEVGKGTAMRGTPVTEAARHWQGWGTALKPALEPITMARKPFPRTVAENVLMHGTGALNIDGCRVSSERDRPMIVSDRRHGNGVYRDGLQGSRCDGTTDIGRWPANLIHDGSAEVVAMFPDSTSGAWPAARGAGGIGTSGHKGQELGVRVEADSGSAARFFYVPKADNADREDGLIDIPLGPAGIGDNRPSGTFNERMGKSHVAPRSNTHPTVKPTDLMRYLCRLVTPPGGVVLDPFMGSGSTGRAALLESFRFIGIEREEPYLAIAAARITAIARQPSLF